jgi:hypothetical protein
MADVIVTGGGGSGSSGLGAGMIVGVLVAILAIGFAVWYFGFNGAGTSHTTNINVSPPQINVQSPKPASS